MYTERWSRIFLEKLFRPPPLPRSVTTLTSKCHNFFSYGFCWVWKSMSDKSFHFVCFPKNIWNLSVFNLFTYFFQKIEYFLPKIAYISGKQTNHLKHSNFFSLSVSHQYTEFRHTETHYFQKKAVTRVGKQTNSKKSLENWQNENFCLTYILFQTQQGLKRKKSYGTSKPNERSWGNQTQAILDLCPGPTPPIYLREY